MSELTEALIEAIDALLPQTQCQQCQYPGCRPYATAIVKQGERIDRCLPGGVNTLQQLADLLNLDPRPMLTDMQSKTKLPRVAVIREQECIGCTKCIQACPVDAIIGASQQMHTVIADACTGCELCISPCPVDCIDLIPSINTGGQQQLAQQSRLRYQRRQRRLTQQHQQQRSQHQAAKLLQANERQTLSSRQTAIQAAVERAKAKKNLIKKKNNEAVTAQSRLEEALL